MTICAVGAGGCGKAKSLIAERGQIRDAILDGPLAFDNAISAKAAQIKRINSSVAGDPDTYRTAISLAGP